MSVALSGNSGLSSLSPWSHVKYETEFLCRVEMGDVLIDTGVAPQPNVIKIDVEGFERQALAGLAKCLAAPDMRAIVFESQGPNKEELADFIAGFGYSIAPLTPTAHPDVTN